MAEPVRILLVEDEKNIRDLMALHLLRQGYQVSECETAVQAQEALSNSSSQFDIIIVDWMMPGGTSGVDLIRQYKGQQAILMVTAKSEPQDIVMGLESGADDYLTKPFDPSVLIARVKALLRRRETKPVMAEADSLELNGLKLNGNSHETVLNGELIHLTPSEFKLLFALVQNHGRVLTRDQLIDQIQGEAVNVIGRTIDTHVFGIRKKLENWGDYIETIRGVGYRVKNQL